MNGDEPYDPFGRGRFPVGVRTIEAVDSARGRSFPCEIWYPATAQHAGEDLDAGTRDVFSVPFSTDKRSQAAVRDAETRSGRHPLIAFSHSSGGERRQSTFLCTHLSSHGYVVAALDHSELVDSELAVRAGETDAEKASRQKAWMASRVPDIRFLLDRLVDDPRDADPGLDPTRIGIVGHSFGGWTALAAPDVETRIGAVVALAPAGASRPKPGILRAKLTFSRGRDVPTLYLVAENDVSLPLTGMRELFDRTPDTRRMVILRGADHLHFMDDAESRHEAVRGMSFGGELAWIPKEMRPIGELCPGVRAEEIVRGLALSHLDAVLAHKAAARQFLLGDIEAELARRGLDVIAIEG